MSTGFSDFANSGRRSVRLRRSWKLRRRAWQLWQILSHFEEHAACSRAVRTARRLNIADRQLLTTIKYTGDYLANSITLQARRECLRFHYNFLIGVTPSATAGRIWQRKTPIWRSDSAQGGVLCLTLSRAILAPMEGECELTFSLDETVLSTLTFAIIHGRALHLPCSEALFVGGLQGGVGCRREIREAARQNGELAPAAMLLLAVEAVGAVLGVGHLVGTSGDEQPAMAYSDGKIRLDYDRLWEDFGAMPIGSGFYLKALAGTENDRPISGTHRSRTRRRRLLKAAIRREMEQRLRNLLT